MAVYEYRAFDGVGAEIRGVIDADTAQAARSKLRERGMFPTRVIEAVREVPESWREISLRHLFRRTKITDVLLVTRQLAVLLEAGMPLVEALTATLEQIENTHFMKVVYQVRESVSQGSSFSEALAQHPRVFSPLYVNMVRSGEASGTLEVILARLADYMERQIYLRRKITTALAYPSFIVVVCLFVVTFLMAYIVPTISNIFLELNRALPLPTTILISCSRVLKSFWWAMALGIIAFVVGLRRYAGTPHGGLVWDRAKLRLPLIGDLMKKMAVGRFARTLGTLGHSGIALDPSLEIVKRVVDNRVIASAVDDAQQAIRKGDSLAAPLERGGIFPPIVIRMIALGERSGQLDAMLTKVADAYDDEVEDTLTRLISLLEPSMIVVMGAIVGFIVLAMLLPIFDMSQVVR